MPFGIPKGAMCVQRFDDSLEFCNSHYLSHFAAFFIDARTKRSVVESFALIFLFTQTRHVLFKSFWLGLSVGTLQRTFYGPPVGRARPTEATQGIISKGLGDRAFED